MHWKKNTTQPLVSLAMAMTIAIAVVLAGSFYAAPATAGKPPWAGKDAEKHAKSHKTHGKEKAHKKGKEKSKKNKKSKHGKHGKHFNDKHENVVRHYYQDKSRNGKGCPPGLAKKNNGCMPPGQAKKQWTIGEPLPHEVEHHNLPRDLLSRLPIPPTGKRYVRIASDILLVEGGTDVVIDAIVDILIP